MASLFQEESACASICPKLSYTQRLIGFCLCAGLGWLLSIVGSMTLFGGVTPENLRTFSILYVSGNAIALLASGFLLGPKAQCTKMWHTSRRYTTGFYLFMLVVVLVVALLQADIVVIMILLGIEILAAIWYMISYIPFGRKMVLSAMRSTGICFPCFYCYDSTADAIEELKPTPKPTGIMSAFSSSEKKPEKEGLFGFGNKK